MPHPIKEGHVKRMGPSGPLDNNLDLRPARPRVFVPVVLEDAIVGYGRSAKVTPVAIQSSKSSKITIPLSRRQTLPGTAIGRAGERLGRGLRFAAGSEPLRALNAPRSPNRYSRQVVNQYSLERCAHLTGVENQT